MEEGFDDFNMHINKSKTKTNLYDDSLNIVAFGGRNLDVNSFELYICGESFQDASVFHKTILRTVSSPGK